MTSIQDRVVVITGASGNIGNAVALKFITLISKIVLVDRSLDRLQRMYPDLAAPNDVFFAAPIDVLDENSVHNMVEETLNVFGKIDILINTVGGYKAGTPVYETTMDVWDFMMKLNAQSVFICCRAVIPTMLDQRSGKIINIASRAAITGIANAAAYSASKSAVIKLTESMSAELKQSGINVNCVIPGTIDTPQNRLAMPKANYNHWVSPDSIADVILFLASEAARDIHGAALPIYGLS